MNKIMVDKARLLRRVIIISWITLALCFVVKIFGGNFFEIMCENPNYKALCEYAETHYWSKILIGFISSMLCQCLYLLSILQKYKLSIKELIITAIVVLLSCVFQIFISDLSLITDIIMLVVLPICFLGKEYKKYWQVLIAFVLTFSFQFISLVTKNINSVKASDTLFIGLIYMIDVYIMCFIYYLYRNFQKEKKKMGYLWVLFAGKPADKLKAMKAKREAKIKKLEAEINAIEIELSKKKDEK